MRTTVKVQVPYPELADAGDAVQVFTDLGTGTVDTATPLLQQPAPLFARGLKRFGGFGTEVYGESDPATGFALPPAAPGFGSEAFGESAYAETPSYREVPVKVPPAFGVHKFSARVVDEAGNPQGDALPVGEFFISSERPPSLRSFTFSGFNAGNDRVTFNLARNTE